MLLWCASYVQVVPSRDAKVRLLLVLQQTVMSNASRYWPGVLSAVCTVYSMTWDVTPNSTTVSNRHCTVPLTSIDKGLAAAHLRIYIHTTMPCMIPLGLSKAPKESSSPLHAAHDPHGRRQLVSQY
jgi:hypothetical protein